MSDHGTREAHQRAAILAFHHINEVNEHDREQVLIALIDSLPEPEAEKAERVLFFMREERKAQLELALAIEAMPARAEPN